MVEDKALREDDIFTWTLRTENFEDIAAYQFALRFDASKLEYVSLQQGDLNKAVETENFNLTTTGSGLIKTLWLYDNGSNPPYTVMDTTLADTSSLFLVEFKALEDISALSEFISIEVEDFPAGALSDGEDCVRTVTMEFLPEGFAGNRDSERSDLNNLTIPPSSGQAKIRIHPNPTKGDLVFEITTNTASENTILIYSPTGQQVLRQNLDLEKGSNSISLENISNWQDGLYFYTITNSSGMVGSGKFVKN